MNTEIPDANDATCVAEVFYDADCRFCRGWADRLSGPLGARGFRWKPLQTPGTAGRLGLSETELRRELCLRTAGGQVVGGWDACVRLIAAFPWLKPIALLLSAPGLRTLGRKGYRWVARHRHCLGGDCLVSRPSLHHPRSPRPIAFLDLP